MNTEQLIYHLAVTKLRGIGYRRAKHLLERIPNIEDLFSSNYSTLAKMTDLPVDFLKKLQRKTALVEAQIDAEKVEKFNLNFVLWGTDNYPRRLAQCEDSPLVLFQKGDIDLNSYRFVAVVGTRNATEYGVRICEELIQSFVGKNICVVSGLAYGIDVICHQLCVKHGVPTIGVLAHGLETIYPAIHKKIASQMVDNGGGLLTEYLPYTTPDRENFPTRNRIVAGMSDATIVVESKVKGGSLITAELANDYNRDVFAYPGNVFQLYSGGCNKLIAEQKAHLINHSDDFFRIMNWKKESSQPRQLQLLPQLTHDEKSIYQVIELKREIHVDILSSLIKKPSSSVSVVLFQLEMLGLIRSKPGNMYALN